MSRYAEAIFTIYNKKLRNSLDYSALQKTAD